MLFRGQGIRDLLLHTENGRDSSVELWFAIVKLLHGFRIVDFETQVEENNLQESGDDRKLVEVVRQFEHMSYRSYYQLLIRWNGEYPFDFCVCFVVEEPLEVLHHDS